MTDHKFHPGEIVRLSPAFINRNLPDRIYKVTKELPESVDEYGTADNRYRVKSADEPYERVVRECELRKLQTPQ